MASNSNKGGNVPPTTTTTTNTAPTAAPVASKAAPAALLAPAKVLPVGQSNSATGGSLCAVAVPGSNGSVLLPFTVPGTGAVTCKVGKQNPNWLGRNGLAMAATVHYSPNGCVVVQPAGPGACTVHAFTNGHMAVVAHAACAQPQGAQ